MKKPPLKKEVCAGGSVLVHLDSTPEAFEWLRNYVQQKLQESGVIPLHHTDPTDLRSLAAHIVGDAWGQSDSIAYADLEIASAIKYPPPAIDSHHFSLKAYIKEVSSE